MKNKRNWLGVLVMVLVFGMAVVGCDNDTTNGGNNGGNTIINPFIGTWKGQIYSSNYFTFNTNLTFTYTAGGGTYSFNGNNATLNVSGVTYPISIGSDGTFTYLGQKFKK